MALKSSMWPHGSSKEAEREGLGAIQAKRGLTDGKEGGAGGTRPRRVIFVDPGEKLSRGSGFPKIGRGWDRNPAAMSD